MLKVNSHLSNTLNSTEAVTAAPGACCCCCCCCCCVGVNVGTGSTTTGSGFKYFNWRHWNNYTGWQIVFSAIWDCVISTRCN